MFALGMYVGRSSGPVYFETRPFQERIGQLVATIADRDTDKGEMELEFYEDLSQPVYHPVTGRDDTPSKTVSGSGMNTLPQGADGTRTQEIPVKHSKKLATIHSSAPPEHEASAPKPETTPKQQSQDDKTLDKLEDKSEIPNIKPRVLKPKSSTADSYDAALKETGQTAQTSSKGAYTIQVASYKKFNDAVTQMAILEKKGISSYRVRGQLGNQTWYRVRTGSFKDYPSACAQLEALEKDGIKGMVIKKE